MTQEVTNVQLTPELRARLRGFTGYDASETFPWVPPIYRELDSVGGYLFPKTIWPLFTLKAKDGLEVAQLEDRAGYTEYNLGAPLDRRYVSTSGSFRVETLRRGVKRWKNLRKDDLVTIIPFRDDYLGEDGLLTEEAIRVIPPSLQQALYEAINERSTLTQEELQGLDY
jgi:hypothetical protein